MGPSIGHLFVPTRMKTRTEQLTCERKNGALKLLFMFSCHSSSGTFLTLDECNCEALFTKRFSRPQAPKVSSIIRSAVSLGSRARSP